MNDKKKRRHSLFRKIIVPLIALMLFQSIIFFCATFFGGISATINQNAEDVLKERVINQERNLETQFTTKWTSFNVPANTIKQIYSQVSKSANEPIYSNAALQKEVLSETVTTLIKMLRSNEVTGVFLVLNNHKDYEPLTAGTSQNKYGICIRDYSPTSQYTENEDLLVVRCPSAMISMVGCSVETWWDAMFTFNEEAPGDYFYKPLELAYENPDADSVDLAYFDGLHNYGQSDRMVVSYSIPLVDDTGYPYAVLGIELTADYLKTLIPASSLYANNTGCYALVQYENGSDTYQLIAYNGVIYQQCFGIDTSIQIPMQADGMLIGKGTNQDINLCGSICNMQVYNHNTPYEKQRVALLGMVREDVLYSITDKVRSRMFLVSFLVLIFGCISVLCISRRLTHPINRLSQKVRKMDHMTTLQLDRLNIDEIDDLVESIEDLSETVNRTAIRTEFFSRMSHDMRTPMNAIIGFSSPEMLEHADLKMMHEYMDKIHGSGSFLLTLINEVLDMAKIEMQRMQLREEPIRQREYLAAVVPMIKEVAEEKMVHFEIDTDDSPIVFYGDSQRISQIIMNLLSNAVKFTPKDGTVRLEIKVVHRDEDTVTTRIIVKDNGCGMSEEFQRKMYEPFAQEGSTSGGTGLGLAISRQMVMLMGGTMSCSSTLGKGTVFTISITNRIAAPQPKQVESMESTAQNVIPETAPIKTAPIPTNADQTTFTTEEKDLTGKRILLCEDHPLNAQIATRLLNRRGIVVELACNGAEGLHMFEASAIGYYDLILMDIRMPEMNGIESTKAIRALDREDAKKIPIIAMTANAFKEDVNASAEAGMNEHLSKPIDPKILYKTLETYLCSNDWRNKSEEN